MIAVVALVWLAARDARSDSDDGEEFWYTIAMLPLAITLLGPYFLGAGLADVGLPAWVARPAGTAVILAALALAYTGHWITAGGTMAGSGAFGLFLILWAAGTREMMRQDDEDSEESDVSVPRWLFS